MTVWTMSPSVATVNVPTCSVQTAFSNSVAVGAASPLELDESTLGIGGEQPSACSTGDLLHVVQQCRMLVHSLYSPKVLIGPDVVFLVDDLNLAEESSGFSGCVGLQVVEDDLVYEALRSQRADPAEGVVGRRAGLNVLGEVAQPEYRSANVHVDVSERG